MKTSKTPPLKSDFKFSAKREEDSRPINELAHPRIQAKITNCFGVKKAVNSLLIQMYCQDSEVLFIQLKDNPKFRKYNIFSNLI